MHSQIIAKTFGLPWSVTMQDWEIEAADPSKIDEFLAAWYEIPESARPCLAELIMASFEEALSDGAFSPESWSRYCLCLKQDLNAYRSLLDYWRDSGTGDDCFAVAAHIEHSFC